MGWMLRLRWKDPVKAGPWDPLGGCFTAPGRREGPPACSLQTVGVPRPCWKTSEASQASSLCRSGLGWRRRPDTEWTGGFCGWTRAIVGLRHCWDAVRHCWHCWHCSDIGPISSTCSVWGRWEAALGQVWPLSSSCAFTRSETISWGRVTALRGTWIWKDQWLEARACPRPGSATHLVFKLSVYSLTSLDPQCPHLQNGKIIIKIAMWLYYNKVLCQLESARQGRDDDVGLAACPPPTDSGLSPMSVR